jgi:hypothetical protein
LTDLRKYLKNYRYDIINCFFIQARVKFLIISGQRVILESGTGNMRENPELVFSLAFLILVTNGRNVLFILFYIIYEGGGGGGRGKGWGRGVG